MLLCFVDESDHGDFRGFAAVIADEHATKRLTHELNRLMTQASVDYGIPAKTEIHGHPLFHGKENWKGVGGPSAGQHPREGDRHDRGSGRGGPHAILSERRLLERQARNNHPVHFPPSRSAFQHIVQRADRFAKASNTYALVIADERGDRERHRERFATHQTDGTRGVYMHTKLDALLDTVHFAPSHHSRMLQAADMLAFTYRRYQTVIETDRRAQRVMDRMWSKLQLCGKLYEDGQWP